MAEEIQNLELESYFRDFIVIPLPLHPTKKRWRGFNQAEFIANRFSQFFEQKIQTRVLLRKIRTKTQAELNDEQRINNVKNAFFCIEAMTGEKIIIIDDVSTTRSTLKEACIALKKAGAKEVWGVTFAQG
ncbi:MAG: hypothetical protein KW793_03450 [Candidatus Doudnabacteria bacterium]|nr:hypothetical protein [Candidatus Doudnabacteria bacterium]